MKLSGSIISFVRFIFCTGRLKRVLYNDKWSHLSEPVMDCLIAYLKKVGRWRIDGPNLRCLNKHWRNQIDSRITHIRPVGDVKFSIMSLERLSKMSNVRHLRLDPFLPERGVLESRKRFKKRMSSLRTLTNLTHLELRGGISKEGMFCLSDCFQSVTSVVFDRVPLVEGQSVLPLESSPIRELTVIGKPCCQYLNCSWFDTLRSLDLKFESKISISLGKLAQLSSLTSLSISLLYSCNARVLNVEMLSHLTSLVSLHLPNCRISLPLWITTLANLESLSLKICDYDKYEERIWALVKCLPSLRSLGIMHELVNVHHFLDFYVGATNLRSLENLALAPFCNIGVSMFTQLTRLHVKFDVANAIVLHVFQLPLLEECFIDMWPMRNPPPDQYNILCENLLVLEIRSGPLVRDLDIITCLKSLKKLCLYEYHHIPFSAITKFSVLPNLKELCLRRVSCRFEIEYTPQLQALLEKLDLLFITPRTGALETTWLRPLFPQVRIVDYEKDFHNLSRIGTKSPRREAYLVL